MKTTISIFLILLLISLCSAQVKSELITYKDGDLELEGYLAYDKILKSVRGGVLIVHNANGRNKFIQERADELAKIGYVAFALDLFGKGVVPKDEEEEEIPKIAVVGRPNVGKSSLINALLPDSAVAVGELSEIGKGSHTTTAKFITKFSRTF